MKEKKTRGIVRSTVDNQLSYYWNSSYLVVFFNFNYAYFINTYKRYIIYYILQTFIYIFL